MDKRIRTRARDRRTVAEERKEVKVQLVRPLTRQMADRIRILVDSCQTLQTDASLTIYAGSKTLCGQPMANLSTELNLLLHGHTPTSICKEIQMAVKPKKRRRQIVYGLMPDPTKSSPRAKLIINDILTNHLPRIEEGLRKGYVDENQILVVFDHAIRARILMETTTPKAIPEKRRKQIVYGPPPSSIVERRERDKKLAEELSTPRRK